MDPRSIKLRCLIIITTPATLRKVSLSFAHTEDTETVIYPVTEQ